VYRRSGIVLFLLFGLWAAWMLSREVTLFRTLDVDYRRGTSERVYAHCGDAIPILWRGEFGPEIPHYLRQPCLKAARTHMAGAVLVGGAAFTFLMIGLVRGKAPPIRPIGTAFRSPRPGSGPVATAGRHSS